MVEFITPSRSRATPVIAAATGVHPLPEFDSSAMDRLTNRTSLVRNLASCAACLAAVELEGGQFAGHELIDGSLPALNLLIKEMAEEIAEASDQLWCQYIEAVRLAKGGAA